MLDTAVEVRTNSSGPPSTDEQVLDDQLELIYSSSVWTQDLAWKTYQKRWMIEMSGEGESGKSMLEARYDNDITHNYKT